MATSSLVLGIAAAQPPDNSTGNAAPALQVYKGTNVAPARFGLRAAFDAATKEHLWWIFRLPADYVSGGTVRLLWAANAMTIVSCVWGVSVGAITPADVDTYLEHAQAAATTATTSVDTLENRRVISTSISPAMDSAVAGDFISLLVFRDAANVNDTLLVDAELLAVTLEYTS